MAAKRKRAVLDLTDAQVVHLEVLPELPGCYGTFSDCSGEFCEGFFEPCQEVTSARSAAIEEVPLRDD